jgi:PAS domain-containing protein
LILRATSQVAIIAYTDKAGRITFANKKFCDISEFNLEELHNKDHRLLNSGFHDKEFLKEMYKTINCGKV